jgi:uncharacterized protein
MSVEVNPVGSFCERSCLYCYELPERRRVGNVHPGPVDHRKIQARIIAATPGKAGFSLFGGDPMFASLEDLERLFSFGFEHFKRNGIQTDGAMLTDEHFTLFKRFNVHAGFSIDGPEELNDARVCGTREQTRAATARSLSALRRCLEDGIGCSVISTLTRKNASVDRLSRLLEWFEELDAAGLKSARVHLLDVSNRAAEAVALSSSEAIDALLAIWKLESKLKGLRFDLFSEIEKRLRNPYANTSCAWNRCDPWHTTGVYGIEPDGSRSLCRRLGESWLPVDDIVRVRQAILWGTPRESGGCRGCRFFLQCGGQCPATAIDGDWRNRSADCETWFALMSAIEETLDEPRPMPNVEKFITAGVDCNCHSDSHGDAPHGDHTDSGWERVED